MKELLEALKVSFEIIGADIKPGDFILDCVRAVIQDDGYGSLNDFNDLPCLNPDRWDGWDDDRDRIDKDMVLTVVREVLKENVA